MIKIIYYIFCFSFGFFGEEYITRAIKYIKSSRVYMRPIYALYRIVFKIKYPRIIADGKKRPEKPLSFSEWIYRKGFFPKGILTELNIIVPKSYSELVKKYPSINYIDLRKVEKPNDGEAKNFYHWVE